MNFSTLGILEQRRALDELRLFVLLLLSHSIADLPQCPASSSASRTLDQSRLYLRSGANTKDGLHDI